MNGFDSLEYNLGPHPTTTKVTTMARPDIQSSIARAQELRAEYLAAWDQRVARTWASLFRRAAHLLPTHTKSRDRLVDSAQL